jgi:hypothetical protein
MNSFNKTSYQSTFLQSLLDKSNFVLNKDLENNHKISLNDELPNVSVDTKQSSFEKNLLDKSNFVLNKDCEENNIFIKKPKLK